MLDKWTTLWIKPPLTAIAKQLDNKGIKANQVTLGGFITGMLAIPLLGFQLYIPALLAILCNRIMDGLDGALARIQSPSDAGGFLDITLDFIFYSGVVFGFAWANPDQNAPDSLSTDIFLYGNRCQLSGLCHYGREASAGRSPFSSQVILLHWRTG